MDHFKQIAQREKDKKMSQDELMKQLEKELDEKYLNMNERERNRNVCLSDRMQRIRDHLEKV